jgi:hypothetical protein
VETTYSSDDRIRTWHAAICLLHTHAPMVRWRTTDPDEEFWWAVGRNQRDQVLPDRVLGGLNSESYFYYSDIRSAAVFRDFKVNQEVFSCDWVGLIHQLDGVRSLRLRHYRDTEAEGGESYDAVELTVDRESASCVG